MKKRREGRGIKIGDRVKITAFHPSWSVMKMRREEVGKVVGISAAPYFAISKIKVGYYYKREEFELIKTSRIIKCLRKGKG